MHGKNLVLQSSPMINITGRNQSISRLFKRRQLSKKGSIRDYHFWLDVASHTSCPIRLQDSMIINISSLDFLHGDNHQIQVASETITSGSVLPVVSLVQSGSRFFDQYLRSKSSNLLDFLHEDSHQAKVVSGTTLFGWVWQVLSLVQSHCKIL